jgi:hypothetical protein
MRELTSVELQAVSGGRVAPAPRPRHPLLALVVAIVVRLLRGGGRPAPRPETA